MFDERLNGYLKHVCNIVSKIVNSKGQYTVSENDHISKEENLKIFDAFCDKLSSAFKKMPRLSSKTDEIKRGRGEFNNLELEKQCKVLVNFLKIFSCSAESGDLSSFVPNAAHVGVANISNDLDKYDKIELILQSPTGLFEKKIDLKTVQPGEI